MYIYTYIYVYMYTEVLQEKLVREESRFLPCVAPSSRLCRKAEKRFNVMA